jgi:hypothetical protein
LNPSELMIFWASWKQDLSFGKGQIIGRDTMIKTILSALVEVRYIGIRTLSGDNDTWIFPVYAIANDVVYLLCVFPCRPIISSYAGRRLLASPVNISLTLLSDFTEKTQFYWWRNPEYPEKTTDLSNSLSYFIS